MAKTIVISSLALATLVAAASGAHALPAPPAAAQLVDPAPLVDRLRVADDDDRR